LKTEQELPFYVCQECYYVYRTKEEFKSSHNHCPRNHSTKKGGSNVRETPIKYFEFLRLIKAHHSFVCAYCSQSFRSFQRVTFHIKKCSRPPFHCSLCIEVFQHKNDLDAHKKNVHKNEKPFVCTYCNETSFKYNSSLQKHLIAKHETNLNESFKCDKCPKRFIKKVYLTHHKTKFHNFTKPFLCQTCGESFTRNTTLKEHLKFPCAELGKSAISNLTPTKTFPCQHCKKTFKRKDKLNFHVSVHTGEKQFACHICEKAFIRKTKLS